MGKKYLSEHILYQIFLRMPTKPVMRLKCLSKQWNRLISDPNFIKTRSRRMIFLPSLTFQAIDNNVTGGDMAPSTIKLSSPLINPEKYKAITVVGSFNGIVLLVLKKQDRLFFDYDPCDHDMILYNPLSGVSKLLNSQKCCRYSNSVYGFGYGTTADDLKIVRLEATTRNDNDAIISEVFSLKTWSWSKSLELTGIYFIHNNHSGTFANGFLYWNLERNPGYLQLILALDIKTMVFSEMKIPYGYWLHRLGTYNGQLCMVCTQIDVEGYELRVMDAQFGESWSTVCSFASSYRLPIDYTFDFGLLCILDYGKLLMLKSLDQLIIYDMFKDSYMEVDALTSLVQVGRLQSVEYVESLISPSEICSVFI